MFFEGEGSPVDFPRPMDGGRVRRQGKASPEKNRHKKFSLFENGGFYLLDWINIYLLNPRLKENYDK